MLVQIPDNLVAMALESHFIQQSGSIKSTEIRSRDVERRQKYIGEIVCAIVANEYRKQKLFQYDDRAGIK